MKKNTAIASPESSPESPKRLGFAHELKRHLKVFVQIANNSFKEALEFRFNILLGTVTDILFCLTQILIFESLHSQIGNIGNWRVQETRVFLGFFFTSGALFGIFFEAAIDSFSEKVRKGELDLLLMKPMNSQFMMSFSKISPQDLPRLVLASSWLLWTMHKAWGDIGTKILVLIPMLISATLLSYAIRFMIASVALFLQRVESIYFIYWSFSKLGMRPDMVYPKGIRALIWTIIPAAFLASVPTQILAGEQGLLALSAMFMITGIFFWLGTLLWRRALKSYTSASS